MKKFFELINENLSKSKVASLFLRKEEGKLPLITISREKGSGGRVIAYLVAEKLGSPWKVYHKEIVDEIGKQTHLEEALIKEIDEAHVSVIKEIIDDFFGKRYLTFSSYYKHLLRILSTIGSRGYAIVVGRGANFLFPNSLKIRVICEMHQRIDWLIKYEGMSKSKAISTVEEFDKKRLEYGQHVFSHDIRKAHHYDLVIRTSKEMSIEDAADLIVYFAKKRFKI